MLFSCYFACLEFFIEGQTLIIVLCWEARCLYIPPDILKMFSMHFSYLETI